MKKIQQLLKTKFGKVVLGVVGLGLIVLVSSYPTSVDKAYEEYSKLSKTDVDEAVQYLAEEFDGKGIFGKLEVERFEAVIQRQIDEINNGFLSATGGTMSDYNNVKITNVEIKNKSYTSEYRDVLITINNGSSKKISYIEVNLYFEDEEGNIVKSEFTNDSAIIKKGASQTLEKMTKQDGWYRVSCEIADIRFE